MTAEELRILTWTLLGEAAGEGQYGMEAVAHVIRNRAASGRYPSNPAAVAIQNNGRGTYQFSAWNSPSNGGNMPRARYPVGSREFNSAAEVVRKVFGDNPGHDPTQGATHYYSPSGMPGGKEPYWWSSEAKNGSVKIGRHIFATKHAGPVTPTMPTPASERPGGLNPIEAMPLFADVQTVRTGRSVKLPTLPVPEGAGPDTFIYDPIRHAMVPKEAPVETLRNLNGSWKEAQKNTQGLANNKVVASIPYERGVTVGVQETRQPAYEAGTTIATVSTRQSVPTTPSYAAQEGTKPAKTNQVVAGFSVPQGIKGIAEVDKARAAVKVEPTVTDKRATVGGPTKKSEDRLVTPQTLPAPRMEGGALSRDSVAQRAKAQAELKKNLAVAEAPKVAPRPPTPPAVYTNQTIGKVIASGGHTYTNSGGGSSSDSYSPVSFQGTSTGRTYTEGQRYTMGGDTYVANRDGSFTNERSGVTLAGSSGRNK